jgi:hypothetical protein
MGAAELTFDVVMERRFDLVEQIARIEGQHKAVLEPLKDELRLCELFMKDEMNKANLQQVKTAAGQTFFKEKASTGVADWSQVLRFCLESPAPEGVAPEAWAQYIEHIIAGGHLHFLKKDVSSTAIKEYVEVHQGALPPGVKYSTYRDLNWMRGKTTREEVK